MKIKSKKRRKSNLQLRVNFLQKVIPDPETDKPNTPKEKVLPKTGDATNILSYALLLGLSGSILLGLLLERKKLISKGRNQPL